MRVFAVFFLALFACGASLLLLQALTQGVTTASYALLVGVLLLLAIGVFAVVRGGSWLQRLVTPIDEILATTERLASGDYEARAPLSGLPELRSLAAAVNAMADQLEQTARTRRGFFANVTHELRTPLTVLQGDLEGMLDGVTPRSDDRIQSLLEEARHLSLLVEDLRTLSLAEAGALQLRREPVDLGVFLHEVAASFRSEAERAGVELVVQSSAGSTPADVDPTRMREVLANLVLNSLQALDGGGQITLDYHHESGEHRITVEDDGPGIPDEILATAFERFSKSQESRGSGLGLAIAKELVEAHSGSIQAMGRDSGGTSVVIRIPEG
jgi:signal transduction histidine kinase